MSKILTIAAISLLVLHGLIHLMGTTVYTRLGTVEGLNYKTTLLNGRWEIGERGIWIFGALWGVAALGFILAAVALWSGWEWGMLLLAGVSLFSLTLTALDYRVAFMGVAINVVILAGLWLVPQILAGK